MSLMICTAWLSFHRMLMDAELHIKESQACLVLKRTCCTALKDPQPGPLDIAGFMNRLIVACLHEYPPDVAGTCTICPRRRRPTSRSQAT